MKPLDNSLLVQEGIITPKGEVMYTPYADRLENIIHGSKRADLWIGTLREEAAEKLFVICGNDDKPRLLKNCTFREVTDLVRWLTSPPQRDNYFNQVLVDWIACHMKSRPKHESFK